jgi:hypothetical protein
MTMSLPRKPAVCSPQALLTNSTAETEPAASMEAAGGH